MRATQVTQPPLLELSSFNWMAHTEFTLRPRFARTGVVGHDIVAYDFNCVWTLDQEIKVATVRRLRHAFVIERRIAPRRR